MSTPTAARGATVSKSISQAKDTPKKRKPLTQDQRDFLSSAVSHRASLNGFEQLED
jgi:hypothetical protein